MDADLYNLLENYRILNREIKQKQKELKELRNLINTNLEVRDFGFLLIPYFSNWKKHGLR
jgi:hypothetical protein